MTKKSNHFIVRYSTGTSRNFGKARNQSKSLKSFKNSFRKPVVTNERFRDFLKLPDKDQTHLKSVAGWFYRTQVDGPVRNRGSGLPSDLVTLDLDYATPEFLRSLTEGEVCTEWEWFMHSSRRHTEEKPRLRLFVILAEPVPNDLYGPVSRIIAQQFDPDMEHVDKVSFRPAQMMFMPTISKDGEFVFHENSGDLLDWSELLDVYEATKGDWRDITQLPQVPGENAREVAEKAEDPTEKKGVVGDFCRAYNVMEAIDAFDLPYTEVDDYSGKPRYTYTGGTTTNGAEVQDDGLFLYSHHGSDPCSDMLVNAFDLVRIHKFGEKDEKFDPDGKPMRQRPSFKAMVEFLENDEKYKAQVIKSRYDLDAINDDFAEAMDELGKEPEFDDDDEIEALVGVMPEKEEETVKINRDDAADLGPRTQKRKKKGPPPKDWIQSLQLTQDGVIIANAPNVAKIIQNDKRTRDSVEFNEFTERLVSRHPLRTKMDFVPEFHIADPINGDVWEDIHDMAVRAMIESENGPGKTGYGFKVSDRDMTTGVELAARQSRFHPVQEYFESLEPTWPSVAESLFIDFMGCPDTPYHREAAKLFLVGAVARIYEPGHKFDFVPILSGAQGKRKSTFCRILACDWAGELKANFSDENKLVEQMNGCFIMEMPELGSISRSQVEDVKAFVSATESHVRLAWARRSKVYKRQCVFIGSTNDDQYLIDTTGNRRFWPIKVETDMIDTDKLLRQRNSIWASAVTIYKEMRAAQPEGNLNLSFSNPEAVAEANELQEEARVMSDSDHYAELIFPWLNAKITDDVEGFGELKRRKMVTPSEVWTSALLMSNKASPTDLRVLGRAIIACGWKKGAKNVRIGSYVGIPYYPTQAVLDRWQAEDLAETGGDLI